MWKVPDYKAIMGLGKGNQQEVMLKWFQLIKYMFYWGALKEDRKWVEIGEREIELIQAERLESQMKVLIESQKATDNRGYGEWTHIDSSLSGEHEWQSLLAQPSSSYMVSSMFFDFT